MECFVGFFGFYTGVGVDYEGAIVAAGCSGCGFIWKKAIAINSAAIHIRMTPIKIIVRNAPMISNRAPVENRPTLAFAESVLSDRLAKKAATIAKIQRTTSTKNNAPNADVISPMGIFEVAGVIPRNDESVDQLPFHVG